MALQQVEMVVHRRRNDANSISLAVSLDSLALLHCERGNIQAAIDALQEARPVWVAAENKEGLAEWIAAVARLALGMNILRYAAQLYGASEALCNLIGSPLLVPPKSQYLRAVEDLKRRLSEVRFANAWSIGWQLPTDRAVALAERLLETDVCGDDPATDSHDML